MALNPNPDATTACQIRRCANGFAGGRTDALVASVQHIQIYHKKFSQAASGRA
jgi:hypothetical protein